MSLSQTLQAASLPLSTAEFWSQPKTLYYERKSRTFSLTNFAGRNYPTLSPDLLAKALQVTSNEQVREIETEAQLGQTGASCDLILWRKGLEQVSDPARVCEALQSVAKRGFLEANAPLSEYLSGSPENAWLVWVEQSGTTPVLVFRRKPSPRALFRHVLRGRLKQDTDFGFAWEYAYRNVTHTQFAWEGSFAYRVEEDSTGYHPEDPVQRTEALLDSVIQGLRFGNVPVEELLPLATQAAQLQPENPIAQNALGCTLWLAKRPTEALTAFQLASHYDPAHEGYRQNARLLPNATPNLHLELLPPLPADFEDIAENFAGKVYYAFVGYDDRLAQDMGIQEGERVLDVGGGQRPLKRADVSIDFDVFEGAHRQGQSISREKPLVCGDVQHLPFRDHAFDVACCRMVLEHVLDPASACKELQRVAKRGFLETPNTFWECFYGHPTHRWIIEWEEENRTLVFKRKPFDRIPFLSAIVPHLYTQRDIQRAFEVTYRNVTTTQIGWDEAHPFQVRVEEEADAPYDYMGRNEDATRGSLTYARDLFQAGLAGVAIAESEDALRLAPTPALKEEAIRLRLEIALAMGDATKVNAMRASLRELLTGAPAPNAFANAIPNTSPVLWSAPLLDPSGYADEARHFLFALHSVGANVSAREIRWSQKRALLTRDRERILHGLLQNTPQPDAVRVWHILAPHFQCDPQARINIGRTMFETDRLPKNWVEACNQMDYVWVPSEFNRQSFLFAGVAPEKLRTIPGTIDLQPYNPNCAPLQIEDARGFNFLSLFDWTLRKGWDILIHAFIEEFSSEEDVSLTIKTHSSLGYTTQQIVDQVGTYITDTLRRDLNRIPLIIFQDSTVPDERMPNLYRAANCFVLPTRGEGWGRPFMEAMAMGLPVIGTAWSGQTAFMTHENSLLLDYKLIEVPEVAWRETPTYQGHQWAEPSVAHLRHLMRQVVEERAWGERVGQRARASLEQNFTYAPVARLILQELEHLGVRF
jgi:glycosyltransferase involved in cell wall biosynthesis